MCVAIRLCGWAGVAIIMAGQEISAGQEPLLLGNVFSSSSRLGSPWP